MYLSVVKLPRNSGTGCWDRFGTAEMKANIASGANITRGIGCEGSALDWPWNLRTKTLGNLGSCAQVLQGRKVLHNYQKFATPISFSYPATEWLPGTSWHPNCQWRLLNESMYSPNKNTEPPIIYSNWFLPSWKSSWGRISDSPVMLMANAIGQPTLEPPCHPINPLHSRARNCMRHMPRLMWMTKTSCHWFGWMYGPKCVWEMPPHSVVVLIPTSPLHTGLFIRWD